MSANDDQRIRDLTERLVAMSPEPPPFPEEVTVTTPKTSRRVNPLLVFAGAAALVLIGAGIPLLLSGDGVTPVGTTLVPVTTLAPGTTVPATIPPTSAPTDGTAPTTVGPITYYPVVYLVASPDNSYTGNPTLVPFETTLVAGPNVNLALMSLQLLAPVDASLEMPSPGFSNAIPAGVEVYGVTPGEVPSADGGDSTTTPVLFVDVSEAFVDGAGGLLADVTMLNQMVYTATQFGPEKAVVFRVNGQPIEAFGSEGIDLTGPVGREDYLDELNSIIITQPVTYGGDGLPQLIGIANVFEATVSMRIVESESGELVFEDHTMATCGTGCWGTFEFSLDNPAVRPGRLIQVYWDSPEDGTPSDVVTIPITDGLWQLLPGENS